MLAKKTPAQLRDYWIKSHIKGEDPASQWGTPEQRRADVLLALGVAHKLADGLPKVVGPRLCIHLLGASNCGKSLFTSVVLGELAGKGLNPYWLGMDLVMVQILDYRRDAAVAPDKALDRWMIPARAAGYALLGGIIEAGLPVIFDHSAADANHLALLRYVQSEGYRVLMLEPHATERTALRNNTQRLTDDPKGRFTPEQLIERGHSNLVGGLREQYHAEFEVTSIGNNGALDVPALRAFARKAAAAVRL